MMSEFGFGKPEVWALAQLSGKLSDTNSVDSTGELFTYIECNHKHITKANGLINNSIDMKFSRNSSNTQSYQYPPQCSEIDCTCLVHSRYI